MISLDYTDLLPGLSVDCVIFGFHDREMKVLLLKMKGQDKWALPGGFIGKNENVDLAAVRVLKLRTGLDNIFLQQFYLFGNIDRSSANNGQNLVNEGIIPESALSWFNQRFNTLGYYALVEYSLVNNPSPDNISDQCEWHAISHLPDLIIDHLEILNKAYHTLQDHISNKPIGLNLLPKKFTMPELHALYETVLDIKIDRRNFQRKMLSSNILIKTDEKKEGGAHKSPWLYTFDLIKYQNALDKGLYTSW